MLKIRALDYALWVAAPCLQIWLLAIMRRRGLNTQFPTFFKYIVLQTASDVLLLVVATHSYFLYYYTYWIGTVLSVLLTFALIDELFRLAFRNFVALRNIGTAIFRWGTLLLLITVAGNSLLANNHQIYTGIAGFILASDRAARIMLCLLATLLLLGARYLHIPPRSTMFGIVLGFVVFLFVKVVIDSLLMQSTAGSLLIGRINTAVYLACCLLWIGYARFGSRPPDIEPTLPPTPGGASPGRPLIEVINSLVEESMRKSLKTPSP